MVKTLELDLLGSITPVILLAFLILWRLRSRTFEFADQTVRLLAMVSEHPNPRWRSACSLQRVEGGAYLSEAAPTRGRN